MIVAYLGWPHLYRKVNGRHFCAFNDSRIGLSIREISSLEAYGLKEIEQGRTYDEETINTFDQLSYEGLLEYTENND